MPRIVEPEVAQLGDEVHMVDVDRRIGESRPLHVAWPDERLHNVSGLVAGEGLAHEHGVSYVPRSATSRSHRWTQTGRREGWPSFHAVHYRNNSAYSSFHGADLTPWNQHLFKG